jgi:hypothetical protein
MAKTIPQLTDATTVNAADELIIQQGGITKRATVLEALSGLNQIGGFVSAASYGAVGDGITDDTAALQSAINASAGKVLVLQSNKTYLITQLNITVSNVALIANGSTFKKTAVDTNWTITVSGSGFSATSLSLEIAGGSGARGILVTASGFSADSVYVNSLAVDSSVGCHFLGQAGASLLNTSVRQITIRNFTAAILLYYCTRIFVDDIDIESYITGVYLRDVVNGRFNGASIRTTSPSAAGSAGQNGLLIESTTAASATRDLRFSNWSIANAPEHSVRIGGQLTVQDVWFTNFLSTASGNAGAAATGGCGYKVLGATSVTGQRHRDIFFTNCVAEDVSTTGNGIGNFCAFQISVADNVHLNNCSAAKKSNTFSCQDGLSLESVTEVFVTGCNLKDCKRHAIRMIAEPNVTFPGWNGVNESIHIYGGLYETASDTMVWRMEPSGAGVFSQINASGVTLSGGNVAIRCESATFTDCFVDCSYINPRDTTGQPPLRTSNNVTVDFKGQFYGTFGPEAAGGSVYRELGGTLRIRTADNSWVIISPLLGAATYNPPSLNDGDGATTTVTVTGAAVGDYAEAWFGADTQGVSLTTYVSAANTVSVRFQNETGSVVDLGSATLRARVYKA